jgi:ABC-type lipoprotein release transport system permease subunit
MYIQIILYTGVQQNDFPTTILVITVVISFVGITILTIVIAILVGVHRRIQKQSLSTIQTRSPLPNTLYEEPDCQVHQDNTAL